MIPAATLDKSSMTTTWRRKVLDSAAGYPLPLSFLMDYVMLTRLFLWKWIQMMT